MSGRFCFVNHCHGIVLTSESIRSDSAGSNDSNNFGNTSHFKQRCEGVDVRIRIDYDLMKEVANR